MAVPKIKRRDKNQKIRIPFLNILLVFFCVFLLILSTFIQVKIVHPIIPHDILTNNNLTLRDYLYTYVIIPQIPMVFFVVGFLGKKLGMTSIFIYILSGLFAVPIFALGGGPTYITNFGFGYILAYLPVAFIIGTILKESYSLLNIFKATLIGVLIIHFSGILYMLFIAAIKQEGIVFIKGWILSQSLLKIAYDFMLGLFALFVAKYFNKYLHYLNS